MWHLKATLVHPKLVCPALIVAVCIIFRIAVLAVLFVQSNHIMIAYLSEIVDHDHSFAEISITPPALIHPAVTNIAATTVVPPVTLHTGVVGNHLFPTDVSGPRIRTPL